MRIEGTIPNQGSDTPELRAIVLAPLPNGMFRLRMPDGGELQAQVGRHLRMAISRLLPGDQVLVELSPFDLGKARIVRLLKSSSVSQSPTVLNQPNKRELS